MQSASQSTVIGVGYPNANSYSSAFRTDGAAGGGVVHTVSGRGVQAESMMSAESGSTALLDRNLFHRAANPLTGQS
jgi:hypothetical protein